MRLSYLKTHWTPEDAHAMLNLLDELREGLRHTYGNEIIGHVQQRYADAPPKGIPDRSEHQLALFDPNPD